MAVVFTIGSPPNTNPPPLSWLGTGCADKLHRRISGAFNFCRPLKAEIWHCCPFIHVIVPTILKFLLNSELLLPNVLYTSLLYKYEFHVNGKFTSDQQLVYNFVLNAHDDVISTMKLGVNWVDMHNDVYEMMTERIGAVFMPHGLGHLSGIESLTHMILEIERRRPKEPELKSLRTAMDLQKDFLLMIDMQQIDQHLGPDCRWKSDQAIVEPKSEPFFLFFVLLLHFVSLMELWTVVTMQSSQCAPRAPILPGYSRMVKFNIFNCSLFQHTPTALHRLLYRCYSKF
ncbi:hypothetical protein C5167_018422 [Papaver somniferum]|uniref:Peptidase M24 domain-containing protein n=1 Tax=Papaver somniferum TaxID=3469 RepID=A0A4Y7IQL9_PAPSO|nr:hypothetical protein C5167_018422 [Papaver somniferum]